MGTIGSKRERKGRQKLEGYDCKPRIDLVKRLLSISLMNCTYICSCTCTYQRFLPDAYEQDGKTTKSQTGFFKSSLLSRFPLLPLITPVSPPPLALPLHFPHFPISSPSLFLPPLSFSFSLSPSFLPALSHPHPFLFLFFPFFHSGAEQPRIERTRTGLLAHPFAPLCFFYRSLTHSLPSTWKSE